MSYDDLSAGLQATAEAARTAAAFTRRGDPEGPAAFFRYSHDPRDKGSHAPVHIAATAAGAAVAAGIGQAAARQLGEGGGGEAGGPGDSGSEEGGEDVAGSDEAAGQLGRPRAPHRPHRPRAPRRPVSPLPQGLTFPQALGIVQSMVSYHFKARAHRDHMMDAPLLICAVLDAYHDAQRAVAVYERAHLQHEQR